MSASRLGTSTSDYWFNSSVGACMGLNPMHGHILLIRLDAAVDLCFSTFCSNVVPVMTSVKC